MLDPKPAKVLLAAIGITQSQLAEEMEVSVSYMRQVMNGFTPASASFQARFMAAIQDHIFQAEQ